MKFLKRSARFDSVFHVFSFSTAVESKEIDSILLQGEIGTQRGISFARTRREMFGGRIA